MGKSYVYIWVNFRCMRTNIEIDDKLMARAMEISRLKTKKQVVNEALREFIRTKAYQGLLELEGKVKWEGDLDQSRLS